MRVIHFTASLLAAVFICASLTNAQEPSQHSDVRKMLIIADNQEHVLTGGPLKSFSPLTERLVTTVGLRSPLANVGGRLLMREALKFGREQGVGFVLHLGDAVDISCENEMRSVFEALDEESPGGMWFMTPGNHDGILAGNFAEYQDPVGFDRTERLTFYDLAPLKSYLNKQKVWFYACQSPTSPSTDMARGQAIKLYVDNLKNRQNRQHVKVNSRPAKAAIFEEDGVEIKVPCRIEEIEITPIRPSAIDGYKAIARSCDPQPVRTRKNIKVGQYASFIVQKIDVGGTRIVLLDTSDYDDPTDKVKLLIPIAASKGNLTDLEGQRDWAESLFQSDDGKALDRRNVIVAGHHPFSQLPKDDQEWIAAKSSRYMSAHVHTDTSLIKHKADVWELNVGSTLDYPPQAVIAVINPDFMSVRVAGAETNWDGFISECRSEADKWKLGNEFYRNYRSGLYMRHLLTALREATDMHDARIGRSSLPLEVPTGTKVVDWVRLETAIKDINKAEGKSRTFWACQAYYASMQTRSEKGFLAERVAPKLGSGFKRGRLISYGWASFPPP
jgi:Calcineurin-like phosphoesterase